MKESLGALRAVPCEAFRRSKGAIAQLVERLLCKQDVDGSNPSGSTTLRSSELRMAHAIRIQFYTIWPKVFKGASPREGFRRSKGP